MFHSRIVLSADPEAMRDPVEFIAIECTAPLWPTNLNGLIWGLKFHTMIAPSSDELKHCLLHTINESTYRFGLKATAETKSRCPLKDLFSAGSSGLALVLFAAAVLVSLPVFIWFVDLIRITFVKFKFCNY